MENNTVKPKAGTWANMTSEEVEKKQKINFDVNITQRVAFMGDPTEHSGKEKPEDVFYVFEVKQGDEDRSIVTSAWTLLHELKKMSPLTGKIADITKRLVKGKQYFEVKEVQ